MKPRGKKKDQDNKQKEPISSLETMYRFVAGHQLMINKAFDYQRKRLGIKLPPQKQKLIGRKNDGAFLYKGKPIPNDMDTQYMRVFRAIFESDSSKEYIPYSLLNQRIEVFGEEKLFEQDKVTKRIRNGIDQFFEKTKIPNILPDGREMISYKRGQGVIFINPDFK